MKTKMSESDDPLARMLVEIFPDDTDEAREGYLWSFSPFPFVDARTEEGLARYREMLQDAANKMKHGIDPMDEFDRAMDEFREVRRCQETAERLMQEP